MLDSLSSDLTNLASLNSVQVDGTESSPLKEGKVQRFVRSSTGDGGIFGFFISPFFFYTFLSSVRYKVRRIQ